MTPEKLRLYYPVRPFHINQHWGENNACVINFGDPGQKVIEANPDGTCPVGYEKLYPLFGMQGHNGTDLQAGVQNVYAACAGTVIEKQTAPARGLGLGIMTDEKYDFGDYGQHYIKIRYWHLKSFNVEVGDKIDVGEIIGVSDNTGYSAGNHVHFEGDLMDKDAGGHPIYFNQGPMIAGSINIEPYFTGIYADEYGREITLTENLIQKLKDYLVAYLQSKRSTA